ncbi:MAG: hypothetical protein ACRCYU_04085 [Nocardioides sp.]
MGMTIAHLLLSLVLPVIVAVVGMGLVIGVVVRRAVRDGVPMMRPPNADSRETNEEFTARLRAQIEADRRHTEQPPDVGG